MTHIYSTRVDPGPAHDVVRVWQDGSLIGTLTVDAGCGDEVAALFGPNRTSKHAAPSTDYHDLERRFDKATKNWYATWQALLDVCLDSATGMGCMAQDMIRDGDSAGAAQVYAEAAGAELPPDGWDVTVVQLPRQRNKAKRC